MASKKLDESSDKKEEELEHYVEVMISRGFSKSAIIKGLKKKGWSLATIKKAIKLAKLDKQKDRFKEKNTTETAVTKEKTRLEKKKDIKDKETSRVQIFFFIMFLVSLGLSVYVWIKQMLIAMVFVLLLLFISLIGYRLKTSTKDGIGEEANGKLTADEKFEVIKKYKDAVELEKLRRHNLKEIMRKKKEEELYVKKIEKIKKREEKLKRKQEMKANSKGGKENEKLKKIEKKTERLKQIETNLQSELERIGQKREILEEGKKLGALSKDETDLDLLYEFIQKYERIRLHEITTMFGVPKKVASQWMNILEEYKLAEVYYPAVGSPELRKCKK